MSARHDVYIKFRRALKTLYSDRELEQLVRIYLEDKGLNEHLDEDLARLSDGEPIQYITGKTIFYGLPFMVNKHVLIPRPETEELVHVVISDLKKSQTALDILDVGTGSGCVILSLIKHLPARGMAIDVSRGAIDVCQTNADMLNLSVETKCLDILAMDIQINKRFDVIVSNPPYISRGEMALMEEKVIRHEPALALFTDHDPLIFYRRMFDMAPNLLKTGGCLYFEINEFRKLELETLVGQYGFEYTFHKDVNEKWRILKAVPNITHQLF